MKGRSGASDFGGDLFVVGGQLDRAFLNVGGVQLRLGLSSHTAARGCYREVLAHNVSGGAGIHNRIQHTLLRGIESLGSPSRYRCGFVEDISQPPYFHEIGEGSFLSRLGGDTLPHGPAGRHGSPMNRSE
jgi:hypothetical protein